VVKRDDEIMGYYLAEGHPFMFCKDFYTVLQYIYVLPEHRGSRAFYLMMKHFEAESRKVKAHHMMVGVDSGINIDKISKLFEKMEYNFVGNYFRKTLNDV